MKHFHGIVTREVWLSKVGEWYMPEPTTGCWLWMRAMHDAGYGTVSARFQGDEGKPPTRYAHRVSYELLVGPIPEGLTIDHLCRTRCCVNPDHLEPVTMKVNSLRGASPPALCALKTHCTNGHALTGDNLYIRTGGGRVCKACNRERQARRVDLENRRATARRSYARHREKRRAEMRERYRRLRAAAKGAA